MAKRGLGKGLDALFIDNNTEDGAVTSLKVSEIEPNKEQPRRVFDEAALAELADSIKEHGVIQPLVVRSLDAGGYQIVAGERRWRAARRAGLTEVPVVIRELDDSQTLEIAIIENLQREDLNIVEVAAGYQQLMDKFGMTQEQVAKRVGKSRSAVANTVRLLGLPELVLASVRSGVLSAGHAKAMMALESVESLNQAARLVLDGHLSVRDTEKLVKKLKDGGLKADKPATEYRDAEYFMQKSLYKEMEIALGDELGLEVRIVRHKNRPATLEIEFWDERDLIELGAKLAGDQAVIRAQKAMTARPNRTMELLKEAEEHA